MKIPKMAKIVYRQRPIPRDLPQKSPPPGKIRMQKPQGGGKFLVQIPGVREGGRGWLWQKLIAALPQRVDNTVGLKPAWLFLL